MGHYQDWIATSSKSTISIGQYRAFTRQLNLPKFIFSSATGTTCASREEVKDGDLSTQSDDDTTLDTLSTQIDLNNTTETSAATWSSTSFKDSDYEKEHPQLDAYADSDSTSEIRLTSHSDSLAERNAFSQEAAPASRVIVMLQFLRVRGKDIISQ